VVSCRLSVVTMPCNHSAAICHRMSATLKSTGGGHFGQNLVNKELIDVSQTLAQSGRCMDGAVVHKRNCTVPISSAV